VLPLSSKSHWDVRVRLGSKEHHLHVREPSNAAGLRRTRGSQRAAQSRRDPILERLSIAARYIRDDQGTAGGFRGGSFIVMGDQNSIPWTARSLHDGIARCSPTRASNASFVPAERGAPKRPRSRAASMRRRGKSAPRHGRFQRRQRRQPARRLSATVEGPEGLAAACSGRSSPSRSRGWCGATAAHRAPITGWCGSTSLQDSSMPTGQ
jgi:hypothetical protein